MLKRFSPSEYALPFFKEKSFLRKKCSKCGEYFWTQKQSLETCGEAGSDECGHYTFLEKPPTNKKYTLPQIREEFLSFFEKNNHTRIKPYPVVARWRNDIYLTHASIIDFQPYVTEGISPPPANPLVIAQPSIRLTDIANTGPTFGRHLTIFEMGGAHAFNYENNEIYWKDQTVRYFHDFVTNALGIQSDEVVYKEDVWIGGGNAGPDVECIIGGLEVGTLVFMEYKVVGDEFIRLPIRTVDTGYGLDRFAWLSQGASNCFQAIYGDLLDKVFEYSSIPNVDEKFLMQIAKYSGIVSVDKKINRLEARKRVSKLSKIPLEEMDKFLLPIENVWAILDHTKCLSFMLSEGVVPSNIQEGYLVRLLFRRVYRLFLSLNMDIDKLYDIIDLQVKYWGKDYPQICQMRNEILEMLKVEQQKFEDTLKRGEGLVRRITEDLKNSGKKSLSENKLSELYDSHGLPPEIVKNVAEAQGVSVNIPENFYNLVAKRHMQSNITISQEKSIWLVSALISKALSFPVYKVT